MLALISVTAPSLATAPVDYARDVLPILSDNCYHCHGPDEKARKAKLRLDTREGAFRLRDGVSVLIPGKSAESELWKRISSNDADEQMPPPQGVRKLTPTQVQTLRAWIDQGAKWGQHWAFVPPVRPPLPEVHDPSWPKNDLDKFVLASLEKEKLSPRPQADRERLIRRVSFDLNGLPPTPAEIDVFLADTSPSAYEKVVDRLLASPRYGERMATDWLDVARYADTHGYQADRFRPMHAYRDWVIKAFNQNLSYDQFLTWNLAGDLLPNATKDQRLATAFNRLHMQNEEGGIVEEEFRVAYVVDRVDTMGTAFLAMTFECCRCHDHKYDPIAQKDFYSLFSFFQNIDESGQTTYFTSSMPVPTLLLSTDEQDAQLRKLDANIADRHTRVAVARFQSADAFSTWLKSAPTKIEGELPGCIAHYAFDELSAGKIVNSVDSKTPGRLIEKPELVDGRGGKVARLSGENGFAFPGVGHFSRVDPFTLALWLKPGDLAARQVVLHQSKAPIDAGSRGYELLLENGHVAFGLHHMWPGNSLKVTTKESIPKNQWAHVTVAYDGSSKAAGLAVYINGIAAELETVRDGLWKDITYGGAEPDLAIGQRFRDNGFKEGEVDDFRIYNRAISLPEAAHLAGHTLLTDALKSADRPDAAQRETLRAYYESAVSPSLNEARNALHGARKNQNEFVNPIAEAMVMQELPQPKPAYILKRGNYDQHGDAVQADTPKALPPFAANEPRNRLGLAHWLTDPQHPLASRVAANRLWQQMFGRGIVETSENFGQTGAMPSQPELLDFLARVYVDDFKWDTKRLLKLIAMSAVYQQSSKAPLELLARDPQNALLARGPARRLTAEMLRDQALADSGLLVEKAGGPSVKPYQPAGLWEIAMGRPTYDQGHGEALYRRSLYTFIKRTVAPPTLLTFDAGDRSVCQVRRQSTSTPLQALTLLNDVQMTEAARKVAERMLREGGTDKDRVRFGFRVITGRKPTEREMNVLIAMLTEQRDLLKRDAGAAKRLLVVGESKADATLDPLELAACTVLVQALFNHDEAVMRR